MSRRSIERLPFWLGSVFESGRSARLTIFATKTTGFFWSGAFSLGLPVEVADFIHEHCKCANCGARINRDLRRCECGKPTRYRHVHLEVECFGVESWKLLQTLIKREESRMISLRRRAHVKSNGGSLNKQDIADLYLIQEGLCYFCGKEISFEAGENKLHADHYKPIALGGNNDVLNIVLTCSTCNLSKGSMHGNHFDKYAKEIRTQDIEQKLAAIRKQLKKYRAHRRLNSGSEESEK